MAQGMKYRILNMADMAACPDALAPLASVAEVVPVPADSQRLLELLPEFDAYYASLEVQVTERVLDKARRLRVIATPSTGTDHLDVAAAAARNIVILSLKDERAFLDGITATAEMAWALLLAVERKLPWSFAAAQRGQWARDRFRGHQLAGKTLGVLGYGRLGAMVADYGLAFRMRVLACDTQPVVPKPGITMVGFDELLGESDIVSIHIHLNDANRRLFNAATLARMKSGAILINTSRGAIIDENALLQALQNGRLGGAGVDVIDGEWNRNLEKHPLISYARDHDNLVISPHTGGVTYESQAMAYRFMAEKLKRFLEQIVSDRTK